MLHKIIIPAKELNRSHCVYLQAQQITAAIFRTNKNLSSIIVKSIHVLREINMDFTAKENRVFQF
jgi:hypothetical protein